MASSYVDPEARTSEERSRGAYLGWTNGGGETPLGPSRSISHHEEDGESEENATPERREEPGRGFFVPNEDLGEPGVKMVRAPADADMMDLSSSGGKCFACEFVNKKDETNDPFNEGDVRDAFSDMTRLQRDNYGKMSTPELVDMIYNFYEIEIRPMGYQEWSRVSIARHILFHENDEDVMMQETTDMLYAQLQSLRSRTWCYNATENTTEPHHKNINTMLHVCRALGDHLTKKKNRVK